MTEKGIHDLAADEVQRRYGLVKEELKRRNRGKKPFRMEPVDNDTLLYIYDNMTEQDVMYGIKTYGEEAVNNFMFEMEQLKQRRNL